MKNLVCGLAAACLTAAVGSRPATAADKPLIGPPPAWVQPVAALTRENSAAAALPIAVLSSDIQLSFDTDGWSEVHQVRAKVQLPQGLQALGAIPFRWSPWSDTLTFHYARILRDRQIIDILPRDGAFTVLRRETGLEHAMLTGELTALLQPEGLRVGDVLEVGVSVRHVDPVLKGRASAFLAGWDLTPIGQMRLQARWPSSLGVESRQTADLAALRRTEAGGFTTVVLELNDIQPVVRPAGSPQRFQHGRELEFTTFPAWSDVAAVMAPLYATASQLDAKSPLLAEAQRISSASRDPKVRAAAVLKLVQGEVRYLAHAEAGGGYLPQSADDTWRLRYGDCKAKTALLLALLNVLKIPAEPVLASTVAGDGLDAHLPSPQLFDHVLVRTRLGGTDYWLDGSREGDGSLDELTVPAFGWVLPMGSTYGKLIRIGPVPATKPQMRRVIRYDASAGVIDPTPTHLETTFRGDVATLAHSQFAALPADRLDAALRQYWAGEHTAFTPTRVAAVFDPVKGEERLTAEGTSKLDWTGDGFELQHVALGGARDIKRDPVTADPDAPYLTDFPAYVETDESVVLPRGVSPPAASIKAADLDEVLAGVAYKRQASMAAGVLRVVASQHTLVPEVSAADERAAAERLTKLGALGVYAPAGEKGAKDAANAAAIDSQPHTAVQHVSRGNALLDAGRLPEAVQDFDAALALEPENQLAWSGRAVTHAWQGDVAAAHADIAKADALGPSAYTMHARGILAERDHDWEAARAAEQKALELDPQDAFATSHLLAAQVGLKDYDAALRTDALYLERHPEFRSAATRARAEIEYAQNHHEQALKTLATWSADSAEELMLRAGDFHRMAADAQARADVDAALRLKPSVQAWLLRAEIDGGYGNEAAARDAEAAAKLAPTNVDVEVWKVNALTHKHDWPAALTMMGSIIADHPDAKALRVGRAQIAMRLGRVDVADADFDAARAAPAGQVDPGYLCAAETAARRRPELALADCEHALTVAPASGGPLLDRAILLHRLGRNVEIEAAVAASIAAAKDDAEKLNSLCYSLAAEPLALDRALDACNVSLRLRPDNAPTLDSRAFVLMRLGRDAEALAAFDAALARDSKLYALALREGPRGDPRWTDGRWCSR